MPLCVCVCTCVCIYMSSVLLDRSTFLLLCPYMHRGPDPDFIYTHINLLGSPVKSMMFYNQWK